MVLRVVKGDGSLLELFHQAIALEKRASLALLISNIALAFSTFVFVLILLFSLVGFAAESGIFYPPEIRSNTALSSNQSHALMNQIKQAASKGDTSRLRNVLRGSGMDDSGAAMVVLAQAADVQQGLITESEARIALGYLQHAQDVPRQAVLSVVGQARRNGVEADVVVAMGAANSATRESTTLGWLLFFGAVSVALAAVSFLGLSARKRAVRLKKKLRHVMLL